MKTFLFLFLLVFSTNLYSKNIFSDSIPLLNNSNIESKVYYTEANRGYTIEDMHLKLDSTDLDSNTILTMEIIKISDIDSKLNFFDDYYNEVKNCAFDANKNYIFKQNYSEEKRYLVKGYIQYTIKIYYEETNTSKIIHKSKIYVN